MCDSINVEFYVYKLYYKYQQNYKQLLLECGLFQLQVLSIHKPDEQTDMKQ